MNYVIFCVITFMMMSSAYGLSCLPCGEWNCTAPDPPCRGGLTRDVCGCCDVCAKLVNETCGGPWGISGTCDAGLVCDRDPDNFNADGVCRGCVAPMNYTMCGGRCAPTCYDPSPVCAEICVAGCLCPEGMIQLSKKNKTCVRKDECPEPPVCEKPKVFKNCKSPCPATCDNPNPLCIAVCSEIGCVCPEGMVQMSAENTTCVTLENCPARECESPMIHTHCGSRCPATCDDRSPICTRECVLNTCICAPGWIHRSASDRTCIKLAECPDMPEPPRCEFPQVFKECGSACDPTCDLPYPTICTLQCVVGCACPEGMFRRSLTNSSCVELHECPACERKECPTISEGMSDCKMSEAWACMLSNYRCETFEWRKSMDVWSAGSSCAKEFMAQRRWQQAYRCPDRTAECVNDDAMMCSRDMFGCYECKCMDGKYKNHKNMMAIWQQYYQNHVMRLQMYRELKEECSTSMGSTGCGGEL